MSRFVIILILSCVMITSCQNNESSQATDESSAIITPDDVVLSDFEEVKLIGIDLDFINMFIGTDIDYNKAKMIDYNKTYKEYVNRPEDEETNISDKKFLDFEFHYAVENDYDLHQATKGVPGDWKNWEANIAESINFYTKAGEITAEYSVVYWKSNGFNPEITEELTGIGYVQGASYYYYSKEYENVHFVKISVCFSCSKDFEADYMSVYD